MATDILAILIKTNLAAGAAILLVLALRKPARKAFGARVAYRLWLAAPLAVVASLAPARTVLAPVTTSPILTQAVDTAGGAAASATMVAAATPVLGADTIAVLWLIGVGSSLAALGWRQAAFIRSLGKLAPEGNFARAAAPGVGPAVVGVVFPRIILPADFETRYDAAEQKVVLAHETAHLASGDTLANAFAALAQCLFWFNPFVHLAVRLMRIDQELACDAAVLAAHPDDRRLYAVALLKTQLAPAHLPLGCYWPAGASNPLKERIAMLKLDTPSSTRRLLGSVGVLGFCLGVSLSAWAAQPASLRPSAPDQSALNRAISNVTAVAPAPAAQAPIIYAASTQAASAPVASREAPQTAAHVSDAITLSPEGRVFQRIDAEPSPSAIETLSYITADGRTGRYLFPRTPAPGPSLTQVLGLEVVTAPEPENVRTARALIEAAKAEQARRLASGSPPQPLTPELGAALTTVSNYDRLETSRRQAATQTALLREVQRLRALLRETNAAPQ